MNRPQRHSYSSISTHEECPARYAYSYIYKLPDPAGPAAERGSRLHTHCEDYLNGPPEMPVHYDLRRIGRDLDSMRRAGAKAEEVFLVDKDWAPVENQDQAKLKGIVDVHWVEGDILHIRDFKSGREYPSHRSQLELYSLLGLLRYPLAARVESAAVYIDGGYTGQDGSAIRGMLPYLEDKWGNKILKIESDNDFVASPGSACKWCPYRRSAGGPCEESAKVGL